MKTVILFAAFFSLATWGNIPPRGKAPSLSRIKEDLAQKSREASQIAASIQSLEKEIGRANNRYLERSRERRSLEEKLGKLKEGLQSRLDELGKKEVKAKKLVNLYALEGRDEQDENALLKAALLEDLLRKRLNELSETKNRARALGETFQNYSDTLEKARRDEESLHSLILDLENQKKNLSQNYIASVETKNELEASLESALARNRAYKKTVKKGLPGAEIALIPPLENFASFKGSNKGVTFKYDSRAPVKATAGGKVVYSGELASYGKVIMIDHGREVRSVILGDVEIKVKKGDNVEQGQLVGYTLAEPGLQKSLYYEVRKRNVAQNTLRWLENDKKLANI